MTDFTALFQATLNATITAMVAEAVRAVEERYEAQIVEMQARILDLEENAATGPDIDSDLERWIDNYDFTSIVQDNVDEDKLFEGDAFEAAVKSVVANAMNGNRW
jgi:3-methyladenine DNA glycosylase/8-oxoguanine DNA glycosylase